MTIDTCIFCGGVVTPLDVKELTKMDKGERGSIRWKKQTS